MLFPSGGRWIIKNIAKLISWFILYSGNSIVLFSTLSLAIAFSFFILPSNSGVRNIAILVSLMAIIYILNFNFKVSNIYEKNEGFFYFSAPLSRYSLPALFSVSGLLFVIPFSLVILDNSGINISFGIFYLELLSLLFYYFISLSVTILFRKAQISTFMILFLFTSPVFLSNYINSKTEIIMVSALSPLSLSNPGLILINGFYSILQDYVIISLMILISVITLEKWRGFS